MSVPDRRSGCSREVLRRDWLTALLQELGRVEACDGDGALANTRERVRNTVSHRVGEAETALECLVLEALLHGAVRPLRAGYRGATSVSAAGRARLPTSGVAGRAKALIDARYSELRTLKEVASEVACHPVHLERTFKRAFGISVHRYLRLIRVRAGVQYLAESDVKISAIPLLVGFKSRWTFYRALREITGCKPEDWRSAHDRSRADRRHSG